MSGFKDFDELVTRTPKQLPIGGVLYDFPDRVSARTGLLMLAMRAAAQDLPAGSDPTDLIDAAGVSEADAAAMESELLGDGHARLIEAGHGHAVAHVVQTLTVWHLYGQAAAEQVWNSLGPTPAPNRAARRSPAKATSNRQAASTAGSSSRKPPGKTVRAGGASSSSGR